MKRIFDFTTFLGIVIIIGGAGGYETQSSGFLQSLLIMLSGALLAGIGAYCKERYTRYLRRCASLSRRKCKIKAKKENACAELA